MWYSGILQCSQPTPFTGLWRGHHQHLRNPLLSEDNFWGRDVLKITPRATNAWRLKDKWEDNCRFHIPLFTLESKCCKVCFQFQSSITVVFFFFPWLRRNDEKQEFSNNVLHLFGKQFLVLAFSVFNSSTSLLIWEYLVSSKGEIYWLLNGYIKIAMRKTEKRETSKF